MIVEYFFKKQILPYFVKLKFSMLVLVVDGFVEEQPEFFKVLQAILELLVRSHYHVEGLLVLLLAVDEVLEAGAGVLDVAPRAPLALLADELVALAILQIHLLLLLECNVKLSVQTSGGVR